MCAARALTFLKFCEAVGMQEPEVSMPEITIDVTSEGEEETRTTPHKRSHGGFRNTKCFGDKLMALERGAQHLGISYRKAVLLWRRLPSQTVIQGTRGGAHCVRFAITKI